MPLWLKNYVDLPTYYRNAEDGGSGGSDEGTSEGDTKSSDTSKKTASGADEEPNIEALIAAAVEKAVGGLRKKNEELIGKEKKLKTDLDAAKSKSLSDEEYTEFKTLKAKMENDELLRALAEGKSEEVISKVTARTKLDYDAKIAAETAAKVAAEERAANSARLLEKTLVDMEITKAAAATVKPQYTDLITNLVSDRIKLVDGAVRVVNAEGDIEMTANGAAPLTVADYIETLRNKYTDLFLASSGGGASGSQTKRQGVSSKVSLEAAGGLSMEDYIKLRAEGKI